MAALELAEQLDRVPDAVVIPLGSGGTAAGVALGLTLLGWPTQVLAVRVAPRVVANGWRVAALARGAASLLRAAGGPAVRPGRVVRVVHGLGRGYGYPTEVGERVRGWAAAHGVTLDSTYGAKALGVLVDPPTRGYRRVVFWHTFAMPPDPQFDRAPGAPV
jgi:1-aminocyclopropane-1-carboxylate deaminase/D-cysteine desulfhydrase-like pyridoxal-dependent ACC family enzyme